MLSKSNLKNSLFAIIACILWGSTYPVAKLTYDALSINSLYVSSIMLLTGIKFTLSGFLLIGLKSIKERKIELPNRSKLVCLLLMCLLMPVIHDTLNSTGLANTTGSKAAMLKQVGFMVLPSIVFLFRKDDKFTLNKLFGGILGFASIIVINFDGIDFNFNLGDGMMLLASACAAFTTVVSKSVYEKYPVLDIVGYSGLFGGIIMMITGFLFGGRINQINVFAVFLIVYTSVASASAYVMWGKALEESNISKMSVLKFFEPLSAVVFSGLALGENIFNPPFVIASLLVLAGIWLTK